MVSAWGLQFHTPFLLPSSFLFFQEEQAESTASQSRWWETTWQGIRVEGEIPYFPPSLPLHWQDDANQPVIYEIAFQ